MLPPQCYLSFLSGLPKPAWLCLPSLLHLQSSWPVWAAHPLSLWGHSLHCLFGGLLAIPLLVSCHESFSRGSWPLLPPCPLLSKAGMLLPEQLDPGKMCQASSHPLISVLTDSGVAEQSGRFTALFPWPSVPLLLEGKGRDPVFVQHLFYYRFLPSRSTEKYYYLEL